MRLVQVHYDFNLQKIHEAEHCKYDHVRELRRLLSSIRNGELHVGTLREMSTFELKDIEELAEIGDFKPVSRTLVHLIKKLFK